MKILHICKSYYGRSVFSSLINKLDQFSTNIIFVALTNEKSESDRIITLSYKRIPGIYWYDILVRYKKLIKKADINSFDLLHAHYLFYDGDLAYQLHRKYNIPYIVTCRNSDDFIFRSRRYLGKRGIRVLKNAARIVFLSPAYRDTFLNDYAPASLNETFVSKSVLIPNGIDRFWHENKNSPKRLADKKSLKLLTVGEINANKNQLTVALALEKLIEDGFDIVYTVVGKVTDDKILRQLLDFRFVRHIEEQPKEKLIEIYRESDIFIMVSLTESFGLVYAEAMSQGLPVIYSRGQGFDCQFEEGFTGYHAEAGNPQNISETIISISEKYDEISTHCVESVDSFDWERIAGRYHEIYQNLI